METRLFVVGLALGLWHQAARRRGSSRPGLWRCAFGALLGAAASLLLLSSYLGAEASGLPSAREWAAAALFGALGALWAKTTPPEDPSDPLAEALPWAAAAAAAALGGAFVTAFVVQPFRIPTGSMEDTLRVGDRVLVEKVSRRLGAARRGDLLAFRFPEDRPSLHCTGLLGGKDFLKRVVALPGETVEVREAVLYVNGTPAGPEPWAKRLSAGACAHPPAALTPAEYQKAWEEGRLDQEQGEGLRDHFGPVTVPPGSYMVLGDNRDASCDSRFWGPVPEGQVKGKAVFIYWPPGRIGRPR